MKLKFDAHHDNRRTTPLIYKLVFNALLGLCAILSYTAAARDDMANADDWQSYGRTQNETHFSPLTEITNRNVSRLSLAWWFDIPGVVLTESIPLEAGGILYFVTGYSVVRAVDAATGRPLWIFDPEVYKYASHKMRLLWGVRGIAYWNHKVYVGTHDGRLIAIDANTGKAVWSVATNESPSDFRIITGAPRVFDGKVIIGHAASEFGPAPGHEDVSIRGYVTAYDAESGKLRWRFYTVPGDPAKGFENAAMAMTAKTWTGQWWKRGGGGTVWNAITYDSELHRIYIGTSNGTPMDAKLRSPDGGDNLFLASIVALDAESGNYLWHYQLNPAETWDYDATGDIELATLTTGGKSRRVLMQASKNGFFYVIDRDTGKLVSAEKFVKVTWADKINVNTGKPVENVFARDPSSAIPLWPSGDGAHSWTSMAFNPFSKLVYIPAQDTACDDLRVDKQAARCDLAAKLIAWDPVEQRRVWRADLPGIRTGGVLTTAGNLVFQGSSEGKLTAYDATRGKVLWSFNAQVGIAGAPMTYRVAGKQYVSVLAGYGGGAAIVDPRWDARLQQRRLLTFTIDGRAQLPPPAPCKEMRPVNDPEFKSAPAAEQNGAKLFAEHCMMCHGADANAGGQAPELRASPIILSREALSAVVKGGLLRMNGMPKFEELSDEELAGIRQYIRSKAKEWSAGDSPDRYRCKR